MNQSLFYQARETIVEWLGEKTNNALFASYIVISQRMNSRRDRRISPNHRLLLCLTLRGDGGARERYFLEKCIGQRVCLQLMRGIGVFCLAIYYGLIDCGLKTDKRCQQV